MGGYLKDGKFSYWPIHADVSWDDREERIITAEYSKNRFTHYMTRSGRGGCNCSRCKEFDKKANMKRGIATIKNPKLRELALVYGLYPHDWPGNWPIKIYWYQRKRLRDYAKYLEYAEYHPRMKGKPFVFTIRGHLLPPQEYDFIKINTDTRTASYGIFKSRKYKAQWLKRNGIAFSYCEACQWPYPLSEIELRRCRECSDTNLMTVPQSV